MRTKPKKSTKSIKQIGETMNSGQNKRKTQTKKREKGWELDFPAALSSTQQHSAANQFQGFLTFCRVRGEKGENEAKKKRKIHQNNGKTHKTNGKRLGIGFLSSTQQHTPQHSAALSSTQQCSICNQFQGFLTFSRVRDEKGENEAKKKCKIHSNNLEKTMKSGQNNGKTHTKQNNGKRLGIGFPSSTQQHSAVLNLQPISRFPDFLQGQG